MQEYTTSSGPSAETPLSVPTTDAKAERKAAPHRLLGDHERARSETGSGEAGHGKDAAVPGVVCARHQNIAERTKLGVYFSP